MLYSEPYQWESICPLTAHLNYQIFSKLTYSSGLSWCIFSDFYLTQCGNYRVSKVRRDCKDILLNKPGNALPKDLDFALCV